MKKRTKNMLIGAGITTVSMIAAGTVATLMTQKLVSVALDREKPESMNVPQENISDDPAMKDFMKARYQAALKLNNIPGETVELIAHDGTRLAGHWFPRENAKRTILAMHGWRSSWARGFGLISDFLFQNDCQVLFVEQRGQNNSGGDYMGFGLLERYDCLDWIRWINRVVDDNIPIYLCGISMGASTVLMTAGFDLPGNVHGIIADCGYTSPDAIWKYVMENRLQLRYDGFLGEIAADICRQKIQMSPKDYSCTAAMGKCNVPVLFIHGTDDDFVPIEMTYENYKACIAPKKLLVVPGAGHGMSCFVDHEGYELAIKQFWQEFDGVDTNIKPIAEPETECGEDCTGDCPQEASG